MFDPLHSPLEETAAFGETSFQFLNQFIFGQNLLNGSKFVVRTLTEPVSYWWKRVKTIKRDSDRWIDCFEFPRGVNVGRIPPLCAQCYRVWH